MRSDGSRICIEFAGKHPSIGRRVWLAPGAVIIGDVHLEDDVSIWFQAVLRGDIEPIFIGSQSNIQDGAVLHTDRGFPCRLGARVTVGHGAIVHGAIVEEEALIGMGAVVLTGARVEKGAIVAAGALVPEGKVIPAGSLAMGVPARPVRLVTQEEHDRVRAGVLDYIKRKDLYLAQHEMLSTPEA